MNKKYIPRNCKECAHEVSIQLTDGTWIDKCELLNEITDRMREHKRRRDCPMEEVEHE